MEPRWHFWDWTQWKYQLYQWKLFHFGPKSALLEFQRMMDQMLAGLPFPWCYIDDVIIFSNTPQNHVEHLQVVFKQLPRWGLCLHHGKWKFFHDRFLVLAHMIVIRWLGVQQAKVDALSFHYFVFSSDWRAIIIDLSRILVWLPNRWLCLQARIWGRKQCHSLRY